MAAAAQIVFCAHSRSGEIEDVRAVELHGVVRVARELQVPPPRLPVTVSTELSPV